MTSSRARALILVAVVFFSLARPLGAGQSTGVVSGVVTDETGGPFPGVLVEARAASGPPVHVATTDAFGRFTFEHLPSGPYEVTFRLVNFSHAARTVSVEEGVATPSLDVRLSLSMSASVVVTGKTTFVNLADAPHPEENLVGVALAASQGAITASQVGSRPIMRAGEVLEAVPGVVVSQHSGEGKANQYYLRGFNLDHGTDFSTTVAGMPVNMPSHGHGQGYADVNFLIPELVSGLQFQKGPYYAQQGDFSAAGAASISYANLLDQTIVRIGGGEQGAARVLAASSPRLGPGHLLVAFETVHNDGPWVQPDNYRRLNGVIRYSQGNPRSGFALTAMAYDGRWTSADQVPDRSIRSGLIPRFGSLDTSDGGTTHRYSGSFEWQRTSGNAVTNVTAYGIGYQLNLFSNFTYFLDDPVNGDQFEQFDRRVVTGGSVVQRRLGRWAGRDVQQIYGVQLRNDDIGAVGLYKTRARRRLSTTREDRVLESSASAFYHNELAWTPKLRTQVGLRADGYRFRVDSQLPENGGTASASLASPKGGLVVGPWRGTELYVNGGYGFHSNDARGTTITVNPATGDAAERVTPLVRARGAELGVRTVAVPHLQSTVAAWMLDLASELVFVGDAGTTEAGRPSRRMGIEWTNYVSLRPWLTIEADLAFSNARFRDDDPAGRHIPGSAGTIVAVGASVPHERRFSGGVRWRYFGSRPLIEDDSARSRAASLVNGNIGVRIQTGARIVLDVFNVANRQASDIDYFYASRLPGEPGDGLTDIHTHPMTGRTARVALVLGF